VGGGVVCGDMIGGGGEIVRRFSDGGRAKDAMSSRGERGGRGGGWPGVRGGGGGLVRGAAGGTQIACV